MDCQEAGIDRIVSEIGNLRGRLEEVLGARYETSMAKIKLDEAELWILQARMMQLDEG